MFVRMISTTLFGLALVAGCDEKTTAPSSPTTAAAAVQTDNCYVCGEHELDVLPDTVRAEHEGNTYYFCVEDCKETFEKDPAKYAARRAAREAKQKG